MTNYHTPAPRARQRTSAQNKRLLYSACLLLGFSAISFSHTNALMVPTANTRVRGVGHMLFSNAKPTALKMSPSNEMTVAELKAQLKERKLPVSGVKAELIKRLESYESSSDQTNDAKQPESKPSTATKKKSTSFPPPKDGTEIKVIEKEVQETVRMLEGLKLGGNNNGSSTSSSAKKIDINDLQSTPPTQILSQQQEQQKKMMQSLKQSLHKSQKNISTPSSQMLMEPSELTPDDSNDDENSDKDEKLQYYIEQLRMKPANDLKDQLATLKLPNKGRKPDLIQRLANYYVSSEMGGDDTDIEEDDEEDDYEENSDAAKLASEFSAVPSSSSVSSSSSFIDKPISFAGIPRLSTTAANAITQAFGEQSSSQQPKPTPIQSVAIPKLYSRPNPSALLHAPTGSGKTLAYLLPITETLWREVESSLDGSGDPNDMGNGMALIILPTRELAAQVAGVATVLAPPGMVSLVPGPSDLMSYWKDNRDRGIDFEYEDQVDGDNVDGEHTTNAGGRKYQPRILVGSAKSLSISLFGDKKLPGTPTSKPEGKRFLGCVRWMVLDEVDRLLNIKKTRVEKTKRHEKPAAILTAAIARLTMGRVQVIAASATVGRPLRRELSRVLGLHSSECPETLRGEEDSINMEMRLASDDEKHVGRAVRIPDTVRNYVLPVDGSTTGSLITSAAFAAKSILKPLGQELVSSRKVLMVFTRGSDIKLHNALGALRHFGIRPEPQSLLDALEAGGTDRLMEVHRKVSGAVGVGGSKKNSNAKTNKYVDEGYLLVTHEDNVRGLHLDGLDAVIVVGRPGSPDEYTHIAGRTGRAGRHGSVLNIVSFEQAAALSSWEKMLGVGFLPVDDGEVASILEH